MRKPLIAAGLMFAGLAVAGAAQAVELCATEAQAAQVTSTFENTPGLLPNMVAGQLGITEAAISSALSSDQAVSVTPEHFNDVWSEMRKWAAPTFLILKGPHIFEVVSKVGPGGPSDISDFYNIEDVENLRGHVRVDLLTAIYALELPGQDGKTTRGIVFYGQDGASDFGVFISGEGPDPSAEDIATFEAIQEMMATRPAVCPAS